VTDDLPGACRYFLFGLLVLGLERGRLILKLGCEVGGLFVELFSERRFLLDKFGAELVAACFQGGGGVIW
jgi:hypothetical protein